MAKKKGKKGKKGNQNRVQSKHEDDDFDPLKNAIIDDDFALPMASKGKKKQNKPKSEETKEAQVPQSTGPLGKLESKSALYKVSAETLETLSGEGLEDYDLADLAAEDLVEMGISEEQATKVVAAVRGDPVEAGPLGKLRALAEAHGISEESFGVLEGEGLELDDILELEASDLVDMGLSDDQAARVLSAAKGGDPVGQAASEDVKLPGLKAKAGEFKIDDSTVAMLEEEGLEDEDLYEMEKGDFKDLGIKIGQVVRLIKAVKAMKEDSEPAEEVEPEPAPKPKFQKPKKNDKKKDKPRPKMAAADDDDFLSDFLDKKADEGGEKQLSKKQLKRLRQKEKKEREAAGGGDKAEGGESGELPKKEDGTVDVSKLSKKAKKKYLARLKKEEEAKKKAEALARLKAERERLEREEEEKKLAEKKRIEDEKKAAIEEAKRKEEEIKRRKEEKKQKRLEMKKAGLILTKKQKEERKRLELARKRMGLPAQAASGDANRRRNDRDKRNRRGGNKPKSKKLQALAEAEAARKKAEEEAAAAAAKAKAKEEGGDEEGDDWDAGDDGEADTWDAGGDDVADDWEADDGEDSEEERKKEEEERKRKEAAEAEKRKKEEEARKLKEAEEAKARTEAKAMSKSSKKGKKGRKGKKDNRELRSPICCILGHVDTGKTKLLDKMRSTNVQDREAGGITQQIGATYFPMSNIEKATQELVKSMGKESLNAKLPGLLMIDTPGHESFTNLRARGSNLCDIAILVVDLMHGLEPQTLESIRLLKERNTPFVVALNKVDRLFDWKSTANGPIRESLKNQQPHVKQEFETRTNQAIAAFAKEAELNTTLYFKNKDPKEWISLVPTSAHTGEGIPDLLWLLVKMTQNFMRDQITVSYTDLQCTVLEVKKVEGLGTTIDVVLVNGVLREGDTIVICGLQGPIVTSIRALLTPPPMKEIRVKSEYVHHKEIKAAMGVKITANGLDHAVAGTQLLVCGPRDDVEDLKDECMSDLASILSRVDPSGKGVYVQASTLGSLEALLCFLEESKVPVSGLAIGPVHKKDVMKAAVMREHREEYAVILAFDVTANAEAKQMAAEMGVTIFTADIIYHLFDMVTKYFDDVRAKRRAEAAPRAVFPCVLRILPEFIFNKRSPIVVGVEVVDGILRKGTPLVVTEKLPHVDVGHVTSIEFEHKERDEAKKGEQVCIKIEQNRGNQIVMLGRHFGMDQDLVSKLSRDSIRLLKENFREDLAQDDWKLVVKLKKRFGIVGKC
mmetsp:Transcript_6939/g.12773  ORF Transcript_6939/g.12773 Transcript_6939/m.12773 type:complete len:1248 (-) Transcript_6939:129-3872(-)|eukprot:CAMPEP_0197536308 /NCGR_PEP_ID=MMETSP1318-20131121/53492_1 /TAXON_ID=552666 /ORGANISM="Partenskyella glossopodia, Strain RCC365" /LENGTH=1247 /DNA_ID=CAMNT_0043094159 /DNA_START=83 /DNA_END=3826 /DNA_ORIENTATION=-